MVKSSANEHITPLTFCRVCYERGREHILPMLEAPELEYLKRSPPITVCPISALSRGTWPPQSEGLGNQAPPLMVACPHPTGLPGRQRTRWTLKSPFLTALLPAVPGPPEPYRSLTAPSPPTQILPPTWLRPAHLSPGPWLQPSASLRWTASSPPPCLGASVMGLKCRRGLVASPWPLMAHCHFWESTASGGTPHTLWEELGRWQPHLALLTP